MLSTLRRRDSARRNLAKLSPVLPAELITSLLDASQESDAAIDQARVHVETLRSLLLGMPESAEARTLLLDADYLVRKTTWIIGGDGWAYDIGYGGLDHVLASGRNINILVLDTEVYSNTGGQQSKSTPIGASARFASAGKSIGKKDLPGMAMNYPHVYVAQIAVGANPRQAIEALREAESYDGPSIVIAYAACQEHGVDLSMGLDRQKLAVRTGYWNLFRRDPRRDGGPDPLLKLDSSEPSQPVVDFMRGENRFRTIMNSDTDRAHAILEDAQAFVDKRYARLSTMSRQES